MSICGTNNDLQLSGRVLKYLCNNRKSSYGKRTDRKAKGEQSEVRIGTKVTGTKRRKAK